jgi:hypothetical protein
VQHPTVCQECPDRCGILTTFQTVFPKAASGLSPLSSRLADDAGGEWQGRDAAVTRVQRKRKEI